MFLRVREFGKMHEDRFPPLSTGGRAFARVAEAMATIDRHQKAHIIATAAKRIKKTTRASVFRDMKMIALAARRLTPQDARGNPFQLPRPRSLARELAAARAFLDEVAKRPDDFAAIGLPPTFIRAFTRRVDDLQAAVDARHDSRTARRQALAGIATAFADGFDAACELDVVVTVTTRDDPVTFAGWRACRHVTRRRPSASKRTATITEPAPAAAPVADPPPSTVEHEAMDKAS
jgi:hypothetical protein